MTTNFQFRIDYVYCPYKCNSDLIISDKFSWTKSNFKSTLILLDITIYYKTVVIKTLWFMMQGQKNKLIEEIIKSRNRCTHIQLFDIKTKVTLKYSREREVFSINAGSIEYSHVKSKLWPLSHTTYKNQL